jgi:hypothetical protein
MGRRRYRVKHPKHDAIRGAMRIVGPLLILVGGVMFAIGIFSFTTRFSEERDEFDRNFGKFGRERVVAEKTPDRFWMCFVGMPIAIGGVFLTRFGYLGAATRYVAGETAPVVKDTLNYVIDGTSESIRDLADTVRGDGDDGGETNCPSCGRGNDADAKFCDECGAALARACPKCGKANDTDAKFCDGCGSPVS